MERRATAGPVLAHGGGLSSALQMEGVEATALWTLHCRAAFADGPVLRDPQAMAWRARIPPSALTRFGRPVASFAARAAAFDEEVSWLLQRASGACVVSLGEGLETQRYRVTGYARWTTVDLADAIRAREQFVQPDDRHQHIADDATTLGWMRVLPDAPHVVVAQGLFMYLEPVQVERIVRAVSERAGWSLVFDIVPPWVSAVTRYGLPWARFRIPRMPWGARRCDLEARVRTWTQGRGSAHLRRIALPARGAWSPKTWMVRWAR